jgi:hypothetical protein
MLTATCVRHHAIVKGLIDATCVLLQAEAASKHAHIGEAFVQYVLCEVTDKGLQTGMDYQRYMGYLHSAQKWSVQLADFPKAQTQQDGFSCGLYVLGYAYCLAAGVPLNRCGVQPATVNHCRAGLMQLIFDGECAVLVSFQAHAGHATC